MKKLSLSATMYTDATFLLDDIKARSEFRSSEPSQQCSSYMSLFSRGNCAAPVLGGLGQNYQVWGVKRGGVQVKVSKALSTSRRATKQLERLLISLSSPERGCWASI